MTTVALAELIRPAKVARAGDRDYPLLSMTMHEGLVDQAAKFKKRVASVDVSDYKVIQRGQLVVGFPIDEGVLDFQTQYDAGIVSPAYGVWDISDDTRVHAPYLKKFLRSGQAMAYYKGKLRGSTARRRSLPAEVFLALRVPLPSLPQQRRIAAILDHADALRAKRREVLAHLDSLTQSIFHDMFGDPGKATENVEFGSVARLAGGRNLVADDSTAHSPYRVLKISAVTTGQFKPTESKPLPTYYVPPPEHLVRPGDLLMSRANTTELVGAVALVNDVPENLALPDKVWRFEWQSDAHPIFFHALFSTPALRRRISRLSSGTGGSMKNVSKAKLQTMPIPDVPMTKQCAFAQRAIEVSRQWQLIQAASLADKQLFDSLQFRAFRGEL